MRTPTRLLCMLLSQIHDPRPRTILVRAYTTTRRHEWYGRYIKLPLRRYGEPTWRNGVERDNIGMSLNSSRPQSEQRKHSC